MSSNYIQHIAVSPGQMSVVPLRKPPPRIEMKPSKPVPKKVSTLLTGYAFMHQVLYWLQSEQKDLPKTITVNTKELISLLPSFKMTHTNGNKAMITWHELVDEFEISINGDEELLWYSLDEFNGVMKNIKKALIKRKR